MQSSASAIEAHELVRSYGDRVALNGLSLDVPAGEVFGLLGPNGSGKSTFISILATMTRPATGTLRVFGESPSIATRARVGTVFQENTADPLMTVNETLRLAGRLFGVESNVLKRRSAELLGAFGLSERGNDATSSLSGGMRRRLEMARALLHDPDLLLLDEPTTGVDPDERRALWTALLGEARGRRTILIATNDLSEADAICDEVAFIQMGRVAATGTPDELKRGLRKESLRVGWEHVTPAQLVEVQSWPGAGTISQDGDVVHITVDEASSFVPRLFALAPGDIRSVSIEKSSLEDAYFQHVSRRASAKVGAPA
jgi:ABC-2 type transport system ATP-binding protein